MFLYDLDFACVFFIFVNDYFFFLYFIPCCTFQQGIFYLLIYIIIHLKTLFFCNIIMQIVNVREYINYLHQRYGSDVWREVLPHLTSFLFVKPLQINLFCNSFHHQRWNRHSAYILYRLSHKIIIFGKRLHMYHIHIGYITRFFIVDIRTARH